MFLNIREGLFAHFEPSGGTFVKTLVEICLRSSGSDPLPYVVIGGIVGEIDTGRDVVLDVTRRIAFVGLYGFLKLMLALVEAAQGNQVLAHRH